MIDITTDIQPLSYFKRTTPAMVKQLKKSGRPIILTIDGKAEVVVMDAKEYTALRKEQKKEEWFAFLRASQEDMDAGRVYPIKDVLERIGKRHGF